MKTFTFSKLSKLGEYDETYGQTYWGEVNEQLQPVMFNSKDQTVSVNDRVSSEEVVIKEGKKGEYHRLKKVTVEKASGAQRVSLPPIAEAEMVELLELMRESHRMLKALTGEDAKEAKEMLDDGEVVNIDDIPY